jgi:hypothetical protein
VPGSSLKFVKWLHVFLHKVSVQKLVWFFGFFWFFCSTGLQLRAYTLSHSASLFFA